MKEYCINIVIINKLGEFITRNEINFIEQTGNITAKEMIKEAERFLNEIKDTLNRKQLYYEINILSKLDTDNKYLEDE